MDKLLQLVMNVLRQHNAWLKYLPNIEPFYAIKCNNPLIFKLLSCGFDIASKEEYKLLKKLNINLPKLIIK